MPVAFLNLCFFLYVLNIESAVSVCNIRVHTINFGCHLEWDCPDANPKTTYTVLSKRHGTSWVNVSGCVQISRRSCDLSHVFPNLDSYNFIRLTSELFWFNETWKCDPLNDSAAKFSPPSVTISTANESLRVTVNFPCSPPISCLQDDEYYEEEEEMGCCPLTEFKYLQVTVALYNKQNLSDRQEHTVKVTDETPFNVEFGFLQPGQVYCAVANFTVDGVLASSPLSTPQCIYIPANNEIYIIVIVCAVLITLGLVFFLVWRKCKSPERPLPKSLALLRDMDLQNETFIDYGKDAPQNESFEGDHVSVVSFPGFTLNQPSYYTTQSLGNGYYSSPILDNPDCTEQSVDSEELSTEVQYDEFHLLPSHVVLETEVGCPYQNQNHLLSPRDIPLNSVRVEHTQLEDLEWSEDVIWGKLNMRPGEDIQAN